MSVSIGLIGGLLPLPAYPDTDNPQPEFCQRYPRPEFQAFDRIHEVGDGWFEAYRVAEGVTAIAEPHQWQEVISYLIEGDERALLFDTGNGIGDIHRIVSLLTKKPVTVLNSHTHYDHVGGNHGFRQILGMDTDFTRAHQAGVTNTDIAAEVSPEALCRPLPDDVTAATHIGRPFEITGTLQDGEVIDLDGRQLEVVATPGHTPDSIALLDRQHRLLWTGDLFYSGPIWLYAPETDLDAYRRSLQRLTELSNEFDWLLPAHNSPRVAADILDDLLTAFDAMLTGQSTRVPAGDGMVEHRISGEARFSFLMRDEPLPYAD